MVACQKRSCFNSRFKNMLAPQMKQRLKSTFSSLLKFLFSALIIYWLVTTGKLDFSAMQQLLSFQTLAVCVLLMAGNFLFGNERWSLLLKSQNIFLSRFEVWRLTLIGVFFNFVVPGGVGGDVIKGYYIAQANPTHRLASVLTVAMDRLIGLFTMVFMAVAVMIWDWELVTQHNELQFIFYFLLMITAGFSFFWLIIFSRRISGHSWLEKNLEKLPKGHHLVHLLQTFSSYAKRKDLFFKSLALSLVAQIFSVALFAYLGHILGFSEISIRTYFFVVPIGFMVTAVPVSPAGVGVGQAAFYYLFNLVTGHESSVGTSTITATQILQFAFGLIGAWCYITLKKKNPEMMTARAVQEPTVQK